MLCLSSLISIPVVLILGVAQLAQVTTEERTVSEIAAKHPKNFVKRYFFFLKIFC